MSTKPRTSHPHRSPGGERRRDMKRSKIFLERTREGHRQSDEHNQLQQLFPLSLIVQELCESRGGRPGLSVLTSLLVSVDVKLY